MKNEKPLITIIVPVYNVEKYLDECINSLINQDYKRIEIILIDDGSKDNSLKICKEFEKKYKNIKLIEQKNSGVSIARNKGIENANGEWICFVDSDDYMEKNMISKMVEEANKETFDILITPPIMDYKKVSEKAKIFDEEINFTNKNKDKLLLNVICRQYKEKNVTHINAGGPWGKLYKTEFIRNNNLSFIVGLKRMQDVIFNLYSMNIANKVIYREIFLYHYRINSESVCLKYNSTIFETFSAVIENMLLFAKENNKKADFYQAIYLKTILLYIEGCRISIIHKDNHNSLINKIKELQNIYNKDIYKNAFICIERKELNFKLKIFTIFAKFKVFPIVYLLVKIFDKTKNKEQK